MSHAEAESLLATLPTTPSIKAVLTFIRSHLDDPTYNHVVRSTLFALKLTENLSQNQPDSPLLPVDEEIVAVSNLLHDMSWNPTLTSTRQFFTPNKRFEVDGADAARSFLQSLPTDHNWDKRRLQLVWDAIALHSTSSIAFYKEAEVAISHMGILIDVVGVPNPPIPDIPESCAVSREFYNRVYGAFPSLKLATYLKGAMCALCKEKPETTFDNFVAGYGEEYVEGYSLKGKRIVDLLKMREDAERDT